MFAILMFFIRALLARHTKDTRALIIQNATLMQERDILMRTVRLSGKRPRILQRDRIILAVLVRVCRKATTMLTVVQPETVLAWARILTKRFWTFPQKPSGGRPRTAARERNLILRLKNENRMWGVGKIQGELLKLSIDLSESTIRRVLADFRRQGKIQASLSWRTFLRAHIDSLYAMDFLTVDTVFGRRFYVLVIIALKSRRIVEYAVTTAPTTLFLRQQLIELRDTVEGPIHLIHDNDPVFRYFPYDTYGIEGVSTSIQAPNMNAHVERFIGSLRREALDWFVIFGERQLRRILTEYIAYYNTRRPHQGIGQAIPEVVGNSAGVNKTQAEGAVVARPVLFGLYHHYERTAT